MSKTASVLDLVRRQSKKITTLGQKSVQKMTKSSVEKYQPRASKGQVVEGQARQREFFDTDYQDIQQLFRHQFPTLTKQLLGKRYNSINKMSHFILPNGMDQAADEVLELLSEFAGQWANTERVLTATGVDSIQALQGDVARSARAAGALKEVTKMIAAAQGGISGVLGLVGSAIDLPMSVIFPLKTIYEIGHVYGFELDNEEDIQAVHHVLTQADLGLIAEKQTLFLALRSLKQVLDSGDYQQMQSFLSSHYSIEQFYQNLVDTDGEYKWPALNVLTKFKLLKYATPILGGAVGIVYNLRLIEEVAEQANDIFATARSYMLAHPAHQEITIMQAYALAKGNQAALATSNLLASDTVQDEKNKPALEETTQAQVENSSVAEEDEVVISSTAANDAKAKE